MKWHSKKSKSKRRKLPTSTSTSTRMASSSKSKSKTVSNSLSKTNKVDEYKPWPEISLDELAKHNSRTDAWIAIRGKIYNITWYINQHPGGVEPLLNYLGRDGTKAFNSVHPYVNFANFSQCTTSFLQVHPYVNFAKILKGHEKGIIEGTKQPPKPRPVDTHQTRSKLQDHDDITDDKEHEVIHLCCGCFITKDKRFPTTAFYDSPHLVVYEVIFNPKKLSQTSSEEDWSIGFEPDKKLFTIKKYLDPVNVWIASYRVVNPISLSFLDVNFSHKFNTCKITLQKAEPGMDLTWHNLGIPQPISHTIEKNSTTTDLYSTTIVHKENLTHDVNLYGIQFRDCVKFGLPIGHHFNFHLKDLVRAYTPVPFSILGNPPPSTLSKTGQIFWFIIKTYDTYGLTEKLAKLPVSSVSSPLQLSTPQGTFDTRFLYKIPKSRSTPCSVLVMFAAGTGITPMLSILRNICNSLETGDGQATHSHAILMFWNKTEQDIIWNEEFKAMTNIRTKLAPAQGGGGGGGRTGGNRWFSYCPVITHPTKTWKGLTGRARQEHIAIMETLIPGEQMGHCGRQALICGPTGFCTNVQKLIRANFAQDKIYVFKS